MSSTILRPNDETFSVRLPRPVAEQVRRIAEGEANGASSVIRRLLMRALVSERAEKETR